MSTSPVASSVSDITATINTASVTEFVASSSQTTFTVDYTATNGTSVVLTNGAAANDVLTTDTGKLTFTADASGGFASVDDATALAIALG